MNDAFEFDPATLAKLEALRSRRPTQAIQTPGGTWQDIVYDVASKAWQRAPDGGDMVVNLSGVGYPAHHLTFANHFMIGDQEIASLRRKFYQELYWRYPRVWHLAQEALKHEPEIRVMITWRMTPNGAQHLDTADLGNVIRHVLADLTRCSITCQTEYLDVVEVVKDDTQVSFDVAIWRIGDGREEVAA